MNPSPLDTTAPPPPISPIVIGSGSTASGKGSAAFGDNATASGMYSSAIGFASSATGDYTAAMGVGAHPQAARTVPLSAKPPRRAATAVRPSARTAQRPVTVLSRSASTPARATRSTSRSATTRKPRPAQSAAIGAGSKARAVSRSSAIGPTPTAVNTRVSVSSRLPEQTSPATPQWRSGDNANATKAGAIAVGLGANATGVSAIAIGTGASATGSVAVGAAASAGNGGAAFGDNAQAIAANLATAVGPSATAAGNKSLAGGCGYNAKASGNGAVAIEEPTPSRPEFSLPRSAPAPRRPVTSRCPRCRRECRGREFYRTGRRLHRDRTEHAVHRYAAELHAAIQNVARGYEPLDAVNFSQFSAAILATAAAPTIATPSAPGKSTVSFDTAYFERPDRLWLRPRPCPRHDKAGHGRCHCGGRRQQGMGCARRPVGRVL